MPRILVINPNTSTEMTARIEATAERVAREKTSITAIHPDRGPVSLESFYEYHLAAVAVLAAVEEHQDDVDGVVVACYGDPGLYPLKEVLDVPVVGVAEGSMAVATLLGHRFAILVARNRAVPMMECLVQEYGFANRLATVQPTGLSVLDLEKDRDRTLTELVAAGESAMAEGAEALLLGCAGLSGYESRLAKRLGIPVVDPVANAVATVEGLIEQDLTQSSSGLWATPSEKERKGTLPGDGYL